MTSSVKLNQEPTSKHLRFGEIQIERDDGEGDEGYGEGTCGKERKRRQRQERSRKREKRYLLSHYEFL